MLYPTARFVANTPEALNNFAQELQAAYCYEVSSHTKHFLIASNGSSTFEGIVSPGRYKTIEDDTEVRLSELRVPIHRKFFQQLLKKVETLDFTSLINGEIFVVLPRKFVLVLTETDSSKTVDAPGLFQADHTVLNYTVHELCEFEFRMEMLFGVGCINRFSVGEGLKSLDFSLFYFHRMGLDYMLGAVRSTSPALMNHQGIRVKSDWARYLYYTRRVAAVFGLEERDKEKKIVSMLSANPELTTLGESFYNDLLASTAEVSAFNRPDAGFPALELEQLVRVKPTDETMLYAQFFPKEMTLAGAFELVSRMTVDGSDLRYSHNNAFWQIIGSQRQYKPLLDLLG